MGAVMSRTGIAWLCVILISGGLTGAWWADQRARRQDSAPTGQNSQVNAAMKAFDMGYALAMRQARDAGAIDERGHPTRQPMPESLAHLQFLADGVRCPVSDRSAIMASCVLQRYGKMRDKALSARARYDALVGLERAYWAALAREGLTQQVEHVPSARGR